MRQPKPLFHKHYNSAEEVIARLQDFAADQSVLLLGSAPVTNHTLRSAGLLCSVNASHAAYRLNHVDILFLNSFSLKAARKPDDVRNRFSGVFGELSCDLLVIIDAAGTYPVDVVNANEYLILNRKGRNQLLSTCLKTEFDPEASGERVPSTGMHAALALNAAGLNVTYQGFSLEQGHALMPEAKRRHVDMDEPIFRLLGIRN